MHKIGCGDAKRAEEYQDSGRFKATERDKFGHSDWRGAYGTESKEKTKPMKESRSRWDNLVVRLRKYRYHAAKWMRTHGWSILVFIIWAPIIWYLARAFR